MNPAFQSLESACPYAWPVTGDWRVADTALLVIDMQRDFLDPDGYFAALGENASELREAVGPAAKVLALARRLGMRVIHTREGHRPDLADLNDTKRARALAMGAPIGGPGQLGRLLVRGEPGWESIAEMAPLDDEIVIDKCGNGAFYATDLDQVLRANGIRNIWLVGVTTDVCVSSTMREANDRGYDVLLVSDACRAATSALHAATLAGIEREGGVFGAHISSSALLEAVR
ncbi:isochorismatase hydrolase [Salinisphaera shabanensis T35B1]|uniref:cysteine hydrolase family protein n=1 Tax=Salinisphaera shabanensis TaxID=180542 RepID=UPI00334196AC